MDEPREIGEWIKISILGSGGFGVVSLWKNKITLDFIAIKKCRWTLPTHLSTKQRERWTNEVKIMQTIDNENIVSYKKLPTILENELAKWNPSKLPLLSMEYCTKGNLRYALNLQQNACGLPEYEVRFMLTDLINAISFLHGLKITHRDIKPENIVLQHSNLRANKTIYKLIDLGYAKEIESTGASFVGTLQYLAPEIFMNDKYSKNVDYWSFGIVVFEVICGVHPFLPKITPDKRFKYMKEKSPNDICIYESRAGEIKYTTEILAENQISVCFKQHMEKWLRIVLRYDPGERGIIDKNKSGDIFTELSDILNKNIITIFSIYNYEFYYYDVDEDTLLCTLQSLLEKDSNILIKDQLLITENMNCGMSLDKKLFSYFDEVNFETILVLFNKNDFVNSDVIATFPPIVKKMFENPQLNQTWEYLYTQYAHSVNYISQEAKLLNAFKKSFVIQLDYIENTIEHEAQSFDIFIKTARNMLIEIEFSNKIINVYDLNLESIKVYRKYLWQTKELIENVNAASFRQNSLINKKMMLKNISENIIDNLGKKDINELHAEALDFMKINKQSKNFTPNNMVKVLLRCIKIRESVVRNELIQDYLIKSWRILREISRILKWTQALKQEIEKMSQKLVDIHTEIFRTNAKCVKDKSERNTFLNILTTDLIQDNVNLRYSLQEVINEQKSQHQNNQEE